MFSSYLNNIPVPQQNIIIIVISVWTLFWKGLALWAAAKKGERYWFVALLVFNTVGILEIIYLAFFERKTLENLKNVLLRKVKS